MPDPLESAEPPAADAGPIPASITGADVIQSGTTSPSAGETRPGTAAAHWSQWASWGAAISRWFCFATLALATTWPLGRELSTSLPLGCEPVVTVPLFNVWTLWWNADCAARGAAPYWTRAYWQAPIFQPIENAFVFSESQPTMLLAAPILWLTDSRVLAYNAYLLLLLILNAEAIWQLLRQRGIAVPVAFTAALIAGRLPYSFWQLGVIQQVGWCGLVWTFAAFWRLDRQPGLRGGVWLGLAFAGCYLLCHYHGLFAVPVLLVAGLWIVGYRWRQASMWCGLVLAGIVAAAVLAPWLIEQRRAATAANWVGERTVEYIQSLSAEPADYLRTHWSTWWGPTLIGPPERFPIWSLGVGWVVTVLASCGLVVGIWRRSERRWTAFWGTVMLVGCWLSLGPGHPLMGWSPYESLMSGFPGFATIRSPYRFGVFVQLGLLILAANAADAAWRWSTQRGTPSDRGTLSNRLAMAGLMALGILAVGDVWPGTQRLVPIASVNDQRTWVDYLRNEVPAGTPLVCLPPPVGAEVEHYLTETLWMYWGTWHRQPLVNGYSGFFPQHYRGLVERLRMFPSDWALDALEASPAEYLVAYRPAMPWLSDLADPRLAELLQLVLEDDVAMVDIYRIRRPGEAAE